MIYQNTLEFAQELDRKDTLVIFRKRFYFPEVNGKQAIYLTGNSLGLQPKTVREHIDEELLDWKNLGVEGHLHGKNPWLYYHHFMREALGKIVGASKDEVVAMNTLTVNLNLLLVSFYRPTKERFKILMEANAFPSDQYAIEQQVKFHGQNPERAIIEIQPREGETVFRTEDFLQAIEENKNSLALVMVGGVNYLNGQFFDMEKITEAAHKVGAVAGFDLAHAAGNIPMKLHDWDVDFACWCSYKYLNSGPGGVGGIFVHEKHANDFSLPRFAGWWGNDESTRFEMKKGFVPQSGAAGWQQSNAQIFSMAAHRASLEIFDEAGIENLRAKSETITGFLEFILDNYNRFHPEQKLEIITPRNKDERGCQLSLVAQKDGKEIFKKLSDACIMADWREPNVIRMAPVPLYNSYEDVFHIGEILNSL